MHLNFKTADPNRRIPTYLQAHTKANVVWQLKLVILMFVYFGLKEWREDRQFKKQHGRRNLAR